MAKRKQQTGDELNRQMFADLRASLKELEKWERYELKRVLTRLEYAATTLREYLDSRLAAFQGETLEVGKEFTKPFDSIARKERRRVKRLKSLRSVDRRICPCCGKGPIVNSRGWCKSKVAAFVGRMICRSCEWKLRAKEKL